MNAHTQPDLVSNAFGSCCGVITSKVKAMPRFAKRVSRRIAEIELELADLWKQESGERVEVASLSDRINPKMPNDERAALMAARAVAVLRCLSQPATKDDVKEKLGLTIPQVSGAIQILVSDGRAVVYGKRGYYWTYVSAKVRDVLEAQMAAREAELAEEARRDADKVLTPAEAKRGEIMAMWKQGVPRHEISKAMKLSRESISVILRKAGVA